MFCSNCGNEVAVGSRFCSSCGNMIALEETSAPEKENEQRYKEKKFTKLWFIPGLTLVLATGLLLGYFLYERHITVSAEESFLTGEEHAKKGEYNKAKRSFQTALDARPHFPDASLNLKLVNLAQDLKKEFQSIETDKKENNFAGALDRLTKMETRLKKYSGKFADQLRDQLQKKRTITMVSQLKFDMKGKDSIDELEPILSRAESLNVPEAKSIAAEIKKQIVDIVYNKASGLLKEKQFSDALSTVESGLRFDGSNEKLMSLQANIQQQQADFEKAEQLRIQQAMAAAAEEEEQNQTNAVNVLDVTVTLDEYGDAIVKGTIENIATVPISSVGLDFSLYKMDGTLYDTGFVYTEPYTLEPGEKGTFETSVYGVNEELTVTIDKMYWYLN